MATAPAPSPADIASTLLDFSDAEFAAAPAVDVHPREVRLLDSGFVGVAIAAQRRIGVDTQATLPIALAIRCDGERDWDLPLTDNGLLVAMETTTGRVGVAPALVSPKVLESRAGAQPSRAGPVRPPADELAGHGAQIGWTEVRSRIAMDWQASEWTFGLLHFDWCSNLVSVALEGGPPATRVAAPAPAVNPLPDALAPGLPNYQRSIRSPAAPAQGVAFQFELDERLPTTRLIVDAAFAAPARAHWLVDGLALSEGGRSRPLAAIVPMTLLLVGANTVYPWRRDLAVPVYGAPLQPGQALQGCLSLDAFDGAAAPGPGSFAGYLLLDGGIHGPLPLSLTR